MRTNQPSHLIMAVSLTVLILALTGYFSRYFLLSRTTTIAFDGELVKVRSYRSMLLADIYEPLSHAEAALIRRDVVTGARD